MLVKESIAFRVRDSVLQGICVNLHKLTEPQSGIGRQTLTMDVEDRQSKIDKFLAVTDTEHAAAAEAMLDSKGWNVERAIDFFVAPGTTGADVATEDEDA